MKHIAPTVILLASVAQANAQEIAPPKEITSLRWMVGTWSGGGKIAFGGQETEIRTTMTVSIDGQFLKAVSTDESSGFKLTKTTMTGWDASKNEYISYTFTNMAPKARIAHGKLDGKKLVMTSEPWEAEGMTSIMRETVSNSSDTKCGYALEFKAGDKWIKGMDFVLTKSK